MIRPEELQLVIDVIDGKPGKVLTYRDLRASTQLRRGTDLLELLMTLREMGYVSYGTQPHGQALGMMEIHVNPRLQPSQIRIRMGDKTWGKNDLPAHGFDLEKIIIAVDPDDVLSLYQYNPNGPPLVMTFSKEFWDYVH